MKRMASIASQLETIQIRVLASIRIWCEMACRGDAASFWRGVELELLSPAPSNCVELKGAPSSPPFAEAGVRKSHAF